MSKIRVLVGNNPRLLRELISGMLEEQSDIQVAQIPNIDMPHESLFVLIKELSPDFLITTLEDGDLPEPFFSLLKDFPKLKIIAIAAHTDHCVLFEGCDSTASHQIQLSEKTILDLLHAHKSNNSEFLKAG